VSESANGLPTADELQAAVNPDTGRRLYEESPQYRRDVEMQRIAEAKRAAGEATNPEPAWREDPAAVIGPNGERRPAVEVDQRALAKLQAIRAELGANITSEQRAAYENDLAQIMRGRRLGESSEAFEARMLREAVGGDAPESDVPPAELSGYKAPEGYELAAEYAPVFAEAKALAVSPETVAALGKIWADNEPPAEAPEPADYVASATIEGYRIALPGFQVSPSDPQLRAVLAECRRRGISQGAVTRLAAAYAEAAG
jgi:hypothetical protein